MVADIGFIRWIRRIWRIMFSGKTKKYLVVHKKPKIADVADGCGYRVHPADLADPADHVFRKYRRMFRYQRHKVA